MTLPGLGPVRVERGKLSHQGEGETKKAVLEKVGEEDEDGEDGMDQEELEELLQGRRDLDVVLVSTRAAAPLRKTIKRKEEEARKRRRSRRRSSHSQGTDDRSVCAK